MRRLKRTLKTAMATESELLVQFQSHGFAVLRGVMPTAVVHRLRAELLDPTFDSLFAQRPAREAGERYAIGRDLGAFDEDPAVARAMSPLLLDPRVLAFAESVLGPAVQLDSFRVTCFPALPLAHRGSVELGGWHVDRFSHSLPAGADDWTPRRPRSRDGAAPPGYCPPRAINCIGYLQDMDEAAGPLRVVTGSHLTAADHTLREMVPADSKRAPLPDEQLVRMCPHRIVVCATVWLSHGHVRTACRSTVRQVTWWCCTAMLCTQGPQTRRPSTATSFPLTFPSPRMSSALTSRMLRGHVMICGTML
jgi:hypothetical protein